MGGKVVWCESCEIFAVRFLQGLGKQCIQIIFMTHRSFSVIFSSQIGNLSQV